MKQKNIILVWIVFIGFPLLFWAVGVSPRRSVLKEGLSILTLIAFSMMIGQFYVSRIFRKTLNLPPTAMLVKYHKIIGYVFVGILLFHPFFIVFPRYFEAGVEPLDAFKTILTTFSSTGIILGIIAWFLMLIIGITSFFRVRLSLSYQNWRLLHGILSIAFIIVASWHAIDLGRNTDIPMSVFIIMMAGIGILLLLKTYFFKTQNK